VRAKALAAAPQHRAARQLSDANVKRVEMPATKRIAAAFRQHVALCLVVAATPAWAASDLMRLSLEELLDVRVIGASKYDQKQSEVAAAVDVLTRQEIKTFGWRTLDEALASLPGVYTTYDRQYAYLGTRGFSVPGDFNTRILLTINGNRVNDAVYDQAYIGRDFPLDLDLIERIEFIPGPGGAVYGQNALFGVVNVVTRDGASFNGTELAAAYQHPQATREGRASWGRRLDNGTDVLLSVSGMRSRGEDLFYSYGASGISGVPVGLDAERDGEFFGRIAHGAWSFELVNGDRRKEDPTGVYLSDPLLPGTYQRDRILLTQLQYQDRFAGDTLQVSGRLFLGRERYIAPETFGGDRTESTVSSDWEGVEARVLSTALPGHKLMFGIEAQANTRQDQTFDDFTATPDLLDTQIRRTGWRAGVYVQDEWSPTSTLSATLGLRTDRNNVTGSAVSPRLGLIWHAGPDTSVKALYGRAHRAPNVYEHDYDDGVTLVANHSLHGETIDTIEFVADHRVGADLLLRASIYEWTMSGLVTQGIDPVTGLAQYQNGADVTARGVEVSGDKTWIWGGRLRGSLSLQNAGYRGGPALSNSPKAMGKLNFSAPVYATGLHVGYQLQYLAARRTLDGSYLGGYTLSNLTLIADQWARGLEVSLGLYNLFDVTYAQPGSRNNWQNALEQDGRSVRLKLGYRF
jgi:outer membrane receptor protein involved in Fe transport